MFVGIRIVIVLIVISSVSCTLTPNSKSQKGSKTGELKVRKGPVNNPRDLVREEPSAKEILKENGAYYYNTSIKNFKGTVLAFVTPWNSLGYEVAETFAPKFDVVAPVWLQILRKGDKQYKLGGMHDIDEMWMKEIKRNSDYRTKITPRVLFDKFKDEDFSKLLAFQEERKIVSRIILNACDTYRFDGIVLEIWATLALRMDDPFLYNLVIDIATPLLEQKFHVYLAVPPVRDHLNNLFTPQNFEYLYNYVSGFTIMTYDYSNAQRPGPNAPIKWVRDSIEYICPKTLRNYKEMRKKLLLGLNFYGNDFTPEGGGPIVGHEYLRLLKFVNGRLQLDENDAENFFEVKTPTGRHIVFYPTLYSIQKRIELAEELGTGLSIWEIGQGLNYFYDLL
ncbi:chitinase domain-containing protein 1 [Phlebotomus papatasi]|nr:chitinase domain-containing protein 1 [Phlebotomus papatasi]